MALRRARATALCSEPPGFSFAIVGRHARSTHRRLARGAGRRFMRRRMAVTIAAALFAVVAAPVLAQNSESAPAAAAPMKSEPKTPARGTVTVKVTNWRAADLVELQV